jgi:hypothetical protein
VGDLTMLSESEIRKSRTALQHVLSQPPACTCLECTLGRIMAVHRAQAIVEALAWVLGENYAMGNAMEGIMKAAHATGRKCDA